MNKICGLSLLVFLLFPSVMVSADIVLSGRRYSLNLPMQTSLIYGRKTHWIFLLDEVDQDLLFTYSNDTMYWVKPKKIADCSSPNNYDVYSYSPYFYIVYYPSEEPGFPLKYRKIKPYHNLTFIDEGEFEVVPPSPSQRYINPSILADSEGIYVTHHNTEDGQLYLTVNNDLPIRVSDETAKGQWYSKIMRLLNGTKMIVFSDEGGIRYRLLNGVWLGEEKTITEEALRWSGSWAVNWILDMDRTGKCASLAYQSNDTYIKIIPFFLSSGWGSPVTVANSTYVLAPTIARMLNGSHMVAWVDPDTNELVYSFGTHYTGWNNTRFLPIDHNLITAEFVELCFVELPTGLIGVTAITNDGIYFDAFEVSTGYVYKTTKRYSPTITALKVSLVLMFVFTIGLRMFGITKWKLSDLA